MRRRADGADGPHRSVAAVPWLLSARRQLETGEPDALEPPHLDPWITTKPAAPVADAEAAACAAVRLHEAVTAHIDDRRGDAGALVVEPPFTR